MNVEQYYDENAQSEWDRFDRHRTEFEITKRIMAKFLPPPPARILDVGGGPGRYAIHLARQGYPVTLLDLSQANLALGREKADEAGVALEGYEHGNALDLSGFPRSGYEAVLLLGPLYHLETLAERRQATCEAVEVLKPGGILLASFITIYAPFRDAFAKGTAEEYGTLHQDMLREALRTRSNPPGHGFTTAHFAHPDEVRPLMEDAGLQTLGLFGVEGLVAGHERVANQLSEAAFQFWLDLNEQFACDPCIYGAADHLLYVGQK